MRRIIAHAIRGEAQKAHEAITRDLAEKFDSFPIHKRIPPHLTLKRWFELDEQGMNALYKTLDAFAASQKQSDYALSGFGNFGEGVIYVGVVSSVEMSQSVIALLDTLHKVEGLTFEEFDNAGDFHATVAMRALKPFDFEQIWNYLKTVPQPDFKMKFDNIAVFQKPVDKWIVERIWELAP